MKFFVKSGREVDILHLRQEYRRIPAGVLKDLGDFTRAYHPEGTFDPDPYKHALYEGRRQVWQRIMNHIHLTDEKLMRLYMDQPINLEMEN